MFDLSCVTGGLESAEGANLRTPGLKHHSTIFYLNNKTKRVLVYDRIGGVAHSRTHQKKEKEKQETTTHLLQEN